jgi:ATP-binding cassette, subfamily B, bacterial CvaB/MchF/RaxB
MQDDQLLNGDMADNISCFAPILNIEKIKHYAQLACIHHEIERMPMQYHTLVGDMGSSLSGSQKQRVILARALCREPRILFMDEATSHLDVNNESVVNSHIQQLNITRVLVAHRPETVRSAGRQISLAYHGDR